MSYGKGTETAAFPGSEGREEGKREGEAGETSLKLDGCLTVRKARRELAGERG